MRRDIDEALRNWPYDPDATGPIARKVQARDGRWVIQVRQELGVLQMEVDGRPDGARPHGFRTYLDYLRHRAADRAANVGRTGPSWSLRKEHYSEIDREVVQFYQRRMAWLALHAYDRMLIDAEHTLNLIDFVSRHCDDEEYVATHERFRGLVLFHRTQARAAIALERHHPEDAIDAVRDGLNLIEKHHSQWLREFEDHAETPAAMLVEQLRQIEGEIRRSFEVGPTLKEQLAEAVAREDYERAARLRDQIRGRKKA